MELEFKFLRESLGTHALTWRYANHMMPAPLCLYVYVFGGSHWSKFYVGNTYAIELTLLIAYKCREYTLLEARLADERPLR